MIKNIQESIAVFLLLAYAGTLFSSSLYPFVPRSLNLGSASNTAAVYLVDNITPEDLKQTYESVPATQKKLRVFIMPGHEPKFGGAEYRTLKERDMNLALAQSLTDYLNQQGRYEAVLGRDREGWNPSLESYFKVEKQEISSWKKEQEGIMSDLISEGSFEADSDPVPHQTATKDVALRLYGINKWIGENDFDLAVHIHFNDYGSRRKDLPGEYSGFVIYVPDGQYSNSSAARSVAQFIHGRLNDFIAESNTPKERGGIIEDQSLIALGSNNTADAPSILMEYGYIYEPQFQDAKVREVVLREYAYQTFLGIEDFFKTEEKSFAYKTSVFPHSWDNNVSRGAAQNLDVLALQFVLMADGLYPPAGKDFRSCALSGIFGPCTVSALKAFQAKNDIEGDGTRLGSTTRALLNRLFGK
jgi:N-acetylmuramoyl-L-alanine amidase